MTPGKPAQGVLNFQRKVRSSTTSTVSSGSSQLALQAIGGIANPVDLVFDGSRIERRAIMESHALAQLHEDGGAASHSSKI